MTKICSGCGALLQTNDENKDGYIETENYELAKICRRCFRLKNYGEYLLSTKSNDEYLKILKKIDKTRDLVVLVVDLFNINNEITKINEYLSNDILLVLTKRDLLPKLVKDYKLLAWIKKYNLRVVDTVIVSSTNNYHFDELYEKINQYKRSNQIYVVGNTNSGKSTLINKLFNDYADTKIDITTSILPSTTLDMIELPLNDNLTIIDTPGLLDNNSIITVIDFKTLKAITPKKEIKPRTYQIKPNESLIIEGLARIDYKGNKVNSFTVYIANGVKITKTKIGTNDRLKDLFKDSFRINKGHDLVINGLCFIKIVDAALVDVYIPKVGIVFDRSSII